jgi:outer membrane lipoprotein-sorting protein
MLRREPDFAKLPAPAEWLASRPGGFASGRGRTTSGGMNRRTLLALPLLLVPLSARAQGVPLSAQDRSDIARIQTYLDGMRSLKARFLQVAANGSTASGTAWLDRPGKMRFEYDAPSPLLLVANHGLLVFHDDQLRQTTNVPIGSTPLGILLAEHVVLSGDVTVAGIDRQPGQLQITLVRTASPAEGNLTLVFADNPLALKQWAVVDGQRQETRVSLFDVELDGKFDQKLFDFNDPKLQHNQNGVDGTR